ncbi:MAG: asparagine synthase [Bacteroidetes bacterium]|nr:MAG: asparagine synthase [Bacteroidota bacterium]
MLLLTDKMTMATSIEGRVPFLDHTLVEFAATIPSKYKVHGFDLRHVQKEAMREILPPEIMKKKKRGFGCPIPDKPKPCSETVYPEFCGWGGWKNAP